MKDAYIRIRCSEQDKLVIQAMAEQSGMNMSEYLLSLVNNDKQYYHEVEVFAVVKGINKAKTEIVEKGRKSLGHVLVDNYNRASAHTTYKKLYAEAFEAFGALAKQPQHYFYLEVDGEKVAPPSSFSDWVVLGKKLN